MTDPEFLFRFTDVKAVQAVQAAPTIPKDFGRSILARPYFVPTDKGALADVLALHLSPYRRRIAAGAATFARAEALAAARGATKRFRRYPVGYPATFQPPISKCKSLI
jgi:hypothetical protein